MFQLLILALLNLSFNIPINVFPAGTMINLLLPVNIILIILAIISITFMNNSFKHMEQEMENQIRIENLEHLKELLQTMRSQRHDFNHHLQTVYGFLSVNAYEEAKNYLEESFTEISMINEIIRSDNPGLNALLFVKSGEMERHGIKFLVSIRTSVKLPLKISELNTIVGNLLDNAVQKLIITPVESSIVELEAYRQGNLFILKVTDNGPLINDHDRDKLFISGFTTKKGGQGLGLFNASQLLKKYRGEIQVKSEEGLTTIEISLPYKKESANEHS
ncbi:ATP-binding protein [Desulfosporosinus sp. I2]|uniref:sensor histidine kinase n=1 Tax=Desulfosporosinus sp. I2 TaxID=1617025 RepID=UPI001FA6F110|nr:ATP-binding protein [Desulfosporosinus sp. I2]